jgi:hypothetical protein
VSLFSPLYRDWGSDLAPLHARIGITIPPIVDKNGISTGLTGSLPFGVQPDVVVLPGVELDCSPIGFKGAGITGTREASLISVLPKKFRPNGRGSLVVVPPSANVERRLERITRLTGQDAALMRVAGYTQHEVAVWLIRHGQSGIQGSTAVALHRASMAVSCVNEQQLAIKAAARALPTGAEVVSKTGVIYVGRALIDVVTVLKDWAFAVPITPGESDRRAKVLSAARAIAGRVIDAICEIMSRKGIWGVAARIAKIIVTSRTLISTIECAMIREAGDGKCWDRLHIVLPAAANKLTKLWLGSVPTLNVFERKLEDCAVRLPHDDQPQWSSECWAALKGLAADAVTRLKWLTDFNTAFIYQLLLERRTVEATTLFPWLASRHGMFRTSRSGAIGAYAALLELGRAVEIAAELVRRTHQVAAYPGGVGPERVSVAYAASSFADPAALTTAITGNTAMGCAVIDGALSHANVSALRGGAYFGPHHVIGAIRMGHGNWDMPKAIADSRTYAAMTAAEESKCLFTYVDRRHDEYPRWMGMNAHEVILAALVSIFPGGAVDPAALDDDMRAAVETAFGYEPWCSILPAATVALARALIAAIDPGGHELGLFDKRAKDDRGRAATGQGALRIGLKWLAFQTSKRQGRVNAALAGVKAGKTADPVEAVRSALAERRCAGPVADLFVPEFWLIANPDIALWDWVQRGCPAMDPGIGIAQHRRDLIAREVADAQGFAALLYSKAMPSVRCAEAMAILALSVSSFTLDHAFLKLGK